MRSATRITVAVLGAYAGTLGIVHGMLEIAQGSMATEGILIQAVGPPCVAETTWHACLPAMTLLPNMQTSGILACVLGLSLIVGSVALTQHRRASWILGWLCLGLLLAGGGFVPAYTGWVAAAAASQIRRPPPDWARQSSSGPRALSALWPLALVIVWIPTGWLLDRIFGPPALAWGGLLFLVFDLGWPLLTVLAARARDGQRLAIPTPAR